MDPTNLPTSGYYSIVLLNYCQNSILLKGHLPLQKEKTGLIILNHLKAKKIKKLFFGVEGIYVWWLQFKEFLEIMLPGNLKSAKHACNPCSIRKLKEKTLLPTNANKNGPFLTTLYPKCKGLQAFLPHLQATLFDSHNQDHEAQSSTYVNCSRQAFTQTKLDVSNTKNRGERVVRDQTYLRICKDKISKLSSYLHHYKL